MQQRRWFGCVFALTVVLSAASAATKERLVAGYTVEKMDHVALQDPKTGYILARSGECDGAHKYLGVYRNLAALKASSNDHFADKLQSKALPELVTGRGVKIGDTEAQVRQKMGKPTWQGGSKLDATEKVWSYHHLQGTKENGAEYITLFRFQNGRVVGIELNREAIPGC